MALMAFSTSAGEGDDALLGGALWGRFCSFFLSATPTRGSCSSVDPKCLRSTPSLPRGHLMSCDHRTSQREREGQDQARRKPAGEWRFLGVPKGARQRGAYGG